MKKLILIFAAGQFILAAVLAAVSFQFYKATANSSTVEEQLAANCATICDTLQKIDTVYTQSDAVVGNLSTQLYRIGKDLNKTGKRINRIFPKNGDSLIEAGKSCYDTSVLLHRYRKEVAPSVRTSLSATADSVELTGKTLRENRPYSRASQQMITLSIGIIAICCINAVALAVFAFRKSPEE
ncbi:MAG: hypothetical protein IKB74_07280 [Lentisphaeria bacterium]|nr:hypothetical protein [Lentisphaeria bacterium]